MKHHKSIIQSVALVVFIVLAAPLALAQSAPDPTGPAGGRHQRRPRSGALLRALELTDAQQAQMKQIRASHSESFIALRQQLRAKRQEMRQAGEGSTFNEALATQKLAEIAPLKARMLAERFKLRQEQLAVLTPEQRAKMDQMREQRKARRGERRARRG